MDNKPEPRNKIEYYINGDLREISGSKEFIDKYKSQVLPPKKSANAIPTKSWAKWAPEYFTKRLYEWFTNIRVPLFYILIGFWLANLVNAIWLHAGSDVPSWGQEDLAFVAKYAIFILLATGALTATWFTIVIEIIKKSDSAAGQWANMVKYSVYPIVTAMFIAIVPFFHRLEITIPAPFSLFLLIAYLVLNSLFTMIKEAEHIVNGTYGTED